jgi:hypothetical protein
VILHRHRAVVANHEVLVGAEGHRRHVPRSFVHDGRLEERLAVDHHDAHEDFHPLARQADDPLDQHHPSSGHPDRDDVTARRLTPDEGQAVCEVQRAAGVGRLHADAAQPDRQQDAAEDDHGAGDEHDDANRRAARIRAKEQRVHASSSRANRARSVFWPTAANLTTSLTSSASASTLTTLPTPNWACRTFMPGRRASPVD